MEFYVYVHKRKSDGSIFYVGKGKRGRYREARNRSKDWVDIVDNHGLDARIVHSSNDEKEMLDFEVSLIKNLRNMGVALVNKASGGVGISGVKRPDASKRMKAYRSAIPMTDEWRNAIRISTRSQEHREKLSKKLLSKEVNKKLVISALKQFKTDEDKARHSSYCGGKRVMRSDGTIYGSASEAGRKMTEERGKKCSHQNIQRACKMGYNAFGYSWSYVND